ncbi:MAG: M64 family metallopeptidase [Bacteroidota bacterium]
MKFLCLLLVTFFAFAICPSQQTWRVDYYHTGGPKLEAFALDRIVVEPLSFPGHPSGYVETRPTGGYRFEVRKEDGTIEYARGFSSIFAEWITTEEAGKMNRTFHESVRFPEPNNAVDVVILKRNAKQVFEEVWKQRVDPKDMFVHRASPAPQEVVTIEQNGDPKECVDVLLMGDGYAASERSKFLSDARRLTAEFFRHEPYKSRRKSFNIWAICPSAQESGISRPSTGVHRSNPAGSTYDAFGSERYILSFDNRAIRDIACWAPYEFIELLVNNETYGGGGIYNLYATVAVDNDWANYVFIHEFGHHFAGLADEYYTSPVSYQPPAEIIEPWEGNVTALLDPTNLKWKKFVISGTPIPTPWPKEEFEEQQRAIQKRRREIRAQNRPESEMSALFREEQKMELGLFESAKYGKQIGAFQGANYDAKAYYRSAIDCIMFSRNDVPFCPACRAELERVIGLYALAKN